MVQETIPQCLLDLASQNHPLFPISHDCVAHGELFRALGLSQAQALRLVYPFPPCFGPLFADERPWLEVNGYLVKVSTHVIVCGESMTTFMLPTLRSP
jgi:hypothetical protein